MNRVNQNNEKMDMREWGIKPARAIHRQLERRKLNRSDVLHTDVNIDRIKYMESYLAKDKKFIPFDRRTEYERIQKAKQQRQQEQYEQMKPLFIFLGVIVVILIIMWQTGMFNVG